MSDWPFDEPWRGSDDHTSTLPLLPPLAVLPLEQAAKTNTALATIAPSLVTFIRYSSYSRSSE